ncbi:hypothetical protein CKO_04279 [Citrobacter koseri ATCC BAA-895]|uniref:Uncharacterized protein n=1 Tax=Citrobacter koseri (strain ATCC BAA-895 / CDC 4225-83 / SGSC4696) TaxID=290338 RepID=A8APC3_CITK8|nr:hypothetical protein CKO_04279 [Citrobacter koseri ATCC BAA-895]
MIFLQSGDANVHIAAIVFFDMLKGGYKSTYNTSVSIKRQGRGNGKGITGERQD